MDAILDGHNDALTAEWHDELTTRRTTGHIDLPRMREGGVRAAFFAVWVNDDDAQTPAPQPDADGGERWDLPVALDFARSAGRAAIVCGRFSALVRAGELRHALTVSDLDAARDDDGPPAGILHFEGAEAIDPGLEALDHWYAGGLRSLGPVWSRPTAFGHGVPLAFDPGPPNTGPGLTPAGHRLVRRCAELGILVDLAHLNEAGFWDVARAELAPLVVSHTDVNALAPSPRNLTDAQIDAVGQSGGLIGINFGVRFLRADLTTNADTPAAAIAEHARYIADRIGPEHVALGSDFDGTTIPNEVGDIAGMGVVLAALREAGFSDAEVTAIAWDNWRRVLDAWWR